MSPIRRADEFPWTWLRRSVRPFHLAAMVGMLGLALNNIVTNDTPLSSTLLGDTVGYVALLAACLLLVGWWRRLDPVGEWGLLLACGVWTYRALLYVTQGELGHVRAWVTAFVLSTAWVIGTGGAWILERVDHHERALGEGAEGDGE